MENVEKFGFVLIEENNVQEISSHAKIYRHNLSGARLMLLLNDDDNKVFCSSFKTPPVDDSGVAHIMEHSVLCGSRKYPVKEPFVELMKGSLNTFLNAMTYPDKTIYPVASRNIVDFKNLVDVYLDAVFFPELSKEAFQQEGWHYEVDGDDVSYKGVVFNEMKGVFSSPESFLDLAANRALFDQSTYRYESGGYPSAIPELTYEQYLTFHHEKYHPANCWLILYGDLDEAWWLEYLSQEYLSRFNVPDFQLPEIALQPLADKPKDVVCRYPAAPHENLQEKSLVVLSFIVGRSTDHELNFAMHVLDTILIGSAGAPLKKALLEAKLGRDTLDYGYSNEILQTTWTVGLRDTAADKKDEFIALVFSTLTKMVEDGIPQKTISAALNTCEFQLREANFGSYPKGVVYSMNVMASWLYDDDPLQSLKYEKLLENLKNDVNKGHYFENLIRKVFLDNKNYAVVVCNPDPKLALQLDNEERAALAKHKENLSEADFKQLKKMNDLLRERQTTPDSPAALATIPRVSIKDVNSQVEQIPTEELTKDGVKYLYHDLPSRKICYLQLSFDCSAVGLENFRWLSLFSVLLTKCGTSKVPYDEFSQDIDIQTGGISSSLNIYSSLTAENRCGCSLILQGKAMIDKRVDFCRLIEKILFEVDFADLDRVRSIIDSTISRLNNSLLSHGDKVARSYLSASLSGAGFLSNMVSDLEYLRFLQSVNKIIDNSPKHFLNKMNELKQQVHSKAALTISIAGDQEVFSEFEPEITKFVRNLPDGEKPSMFTFDLKSQANIGLSAPGAVQYVAKAINLRDYGYVDHGSFDLLNQLLSTDYLWNKVRVQGGAYGCYLSFDKITATLVLVSYRDPNLTETLKVYDGIAAFLENLELSESEFEKLIIGAVGRLDSPMTTSQKSKLALSRYLAGVDYETLNKRRQELLTSTVEDLRKFSQFFRVLAKNGKICVHGNEKVLNEVQELFDTILPVIE